MENERSEMIKEIDYILGLEQVHMEKHSKLKFIIQITYTQF